MNDLSPPSYLDDIPIAGDVISPPRTSAVVVETPSAAHRIDNPFSNRDAEHVSAGTVAVESRRAAAEVQGRMIVA